MATKKKPEAKKAPVTAPTKQVRLSQAVLPRFSLREALLIPVTIHEQFAGDATSPLNLATAVQQSPQSSAWRYLTGTSEAYGLTVGAYNAKSVELTELGRAVTAPTEEGMKESALRKAALLPSAFSKFLTKYDGKPFPKDEIAMNVLVQECGIPRERAQVALDLLVENAVLVGLLSEIKGKRYVRLDGVPSTYEADSGRVDDGSDDEQVPEFEGPPIPPSEPTHGMPTPRKPDNGQTPDNKRVFITHGKNRALIGQLKEIISFGKLEPIVSVEVESTSVPVPEKIMEEMRSCFAGVIHVASEEVVIDGEGKPRKHLNGNVLIEIGAAMALFGRNFILLVEDGIELPSNLQGLYECRYTGETLDGAATMKLLKAFNRFNA